MQDCKFCYKHFFISKDESEESKKLRSKQGLSDDILSVIDTSDPIQTQRAISLELQKISKLQEPCSLIVDSTTFRKEELLILLKEMTKLPESILNNTSFVYSVASNMGEWLSNNVRQIRPIIGYPGDMLSRQNTHLVILAGVEHHRAVAAIDAYEPAEISLGMVPYAESVSKEIYERNLELRSYLVRHFDNVTLEFDFSAKDPTSVKAALESVVKKRPCHNTIIVPLNTKLSTLGCGAFAIENPQVQLCYAEVEVYNAGEYSTAGDEVLIIAYRDLF